MPATRDEPITVLICDDHRLLADGLALVVRHDPALELVAEPVGSAQAAIDLCDQLRPSVVLMDVNLPGGADGIAATREIKRLCPDTQVVVITGHRDDRLLLEAMEAGASGFLDKTEAVGKALTVLKAAADGEILFGADEFARALHRVATEREGRKDADRLLSLLTTREREVLQMLARGLSNGAIATKLYLSQETVRTHIRNILSKLGVHSKLEAVTFAARNGAVRV